jgi:putative mRNA 3-end processing factor
MSITRQRNGLQISGTPLFLDATRKAPISFVSHAHADHIGRHEQTIATAATLRFMEKRLGTLSGPLAVPYHQPFALGPLTLELLPAGHVLGSAQLKVTRGDGHILVYTGDINCVRSLTSEPIVTPRCDTLVIESTYGHPRYSFPPREESLAALTDWVRTTLAQDRVPVVLGYALGKSQEIMAHLAREDLRCVAHRSVFELTEVYAEFGVRIPGVRCFDGTVGAGEVLVWPPHKLRGPELARVRNLRTAALTGWALEEAGPRRVSTDVSFPLSDHADHAALVAYAAATGARDIVTHHGFAEELAAGMRAAGLGARALGKAVQLPLF